VGDHHVGWAVEGGQRLLDSPEVAAVPVPVPTPEPSDDRSRAPDEPLADLHGNTGSQWGWYLDRDVATLMVRSVLVGRGEDRDAVSLAPPYERHVAHDGGDRPTTGRVRFDRGKNDAQMERSPVRFAGKRSRIVPGVHSSR